MFTHRLTLFELFGFKVRVDASWLLLAVLIVWSLAVGYFPYAAPGFDPATYWWMGLVGMIGLAFSIIIHELAHALVARRYDMPIRGITLFIFGGVAEMTDAPTSAKGEFWMAIAGPAMSIAVALLFAALAGLVSGAAGGEAMPPAGVVLAYLAGLNGLLAVFNMMPAFPLDGGRVLRAALWGWRGDILWATRIAAAFGSAFGLLLIALGLLSAIGGNVIGGIWWFVLGMFVRAAALSQVQQQRAQSLLSGMPVSRFMRRDPVAVRPDLTLDRLVQDYFYKHYFKSFPVADNGRLLGSVTLDALRTTDPDQWKVQTVGTIMEPATDDNTVAPDTDAAEALRRMQQCGKSRLLVARNGQLAGLLSLRDLLTLLSIEETLTGGRGEDLPQARPRKA